MIDEEEGKVVEDKGDIVEVLREKGGSDRRCGCKGNTRRDGRVDV